MAGVNNERPYLEPLVAYINATEKTDYQYGRCLDHGGSESQQRPQPEALYIGDKSGELTIERKLLVWPPRLLERHHSWHKLANPLRDDLLALTSDGPYKLCLPYELPVHDRTLKDVKRELVEMIEMGIDDVRTKGKILGATSPLPWSFRRQKTEERFLGEPVAGLVISSSKSMLKDLNENDDDIVDVVRRYLGACSRKFTHWGHSRRILLLEPHGSFVYAVLKDVSWPELIKDEVDEVWLATFDDEMAEIWSDCWIFERLYAVG